MIAITEAFQRADAIAASYKEQAKQGMLNVRGGDLRTYDEILGYKESIFDQGYGTSASEHYRFFRGWAYVAINAVATRVAGLPWCAAEITNATSNPERNISNWMEKIPGRIMTKVRGGQTLEPIMSHPVLDLLDEPNMEQKSWEFIYFSVANLEISGVAYWILGTAEDGSPNIFAVPSPWMKFNRKKGVYLCTPTGVHEGYPIKPEYVGKTNLPDPLNPQGNVSPMHACLTAVRTDDYIQRSQWMSYERGIHPNLIVGTSKDPNTKERTRLAGSQRRQLIRAIREVWSGTTNIGDPVILDGLIDSVHKLTNSPQEMDWPASGEIVKERIFQAFSVNPYIVGQVTNVNRAQAAVAESVFNGQVVNPLAGALSNTMTSLLGPVVVSPKRLVVYLEEAIAVDREQRLREFTALRKTEDVTRDEMRESIANLPPLEDREDESLLLSIANASNTIMEIQTRVAAGKIPPEAAVAFLVRVFRMKEDDAVAIVGEGNTAPPPPQFGVKPEEDEEDEVEDEEDADEEDTQDMDDEDDTEDKSFRVKSTARQRFEKASTERFEESERRLSQALAGFFRRYYDDVDRQNQQGSSST